MDVSVVIPTYNNPARLLECPAGLAAQEAVGARVEVVVVDDGSTDDTAECVVVLLRRSLRRLAPLWSRAALAIRHDTGRFRFAAAQRDGQRAVRLTDVARHTVPSDLQPPEPDAVVAHEPTVLPDNAPFASVGAIAGVWTR